MCVCDSQGAELGHVVEAGNRDAADVVIVQRSVGWKKRGKEAKTIVTTVKKKKKLFKASCVVASVLKHLFKTHVHTRASLRRPAGNITPHSTQKEALAPPTHMQICCARSSAGREAAPQLVVKGGKKRSREKKKCNVHVSPRTAGSSCSGREPGRFNQRNSPLLISQAALQHPRPLPHIRPPHQQAASVHLHAPL